MQFTFCMKWLDIVKKIQCILFGSKSFPNIDSGLLHGITYLHVWHLPVPFNPDLHLDLNYGCIGLTSMGAFVIANYAKSRFELPWAHFCSKFIFCPSLFSWLSLSPECSVLLPRITWLILTEFQFCSYECPQ